MARPVDWFNTLGRRRKAVVFLAFLPFWLFSPRMLIKIKNLFISLWQSASERFNGARAAIEDFLASIRTSLLRSWGRLRGTPIPDDELMNLVAGTDDVIWFCRSGKLAAKSMNAALRKNGIKLGRSHRILDFGCGVGRVIRYWKRRGGSTVYGTDYNLNLISWCRDNFKFGQFKTNELVGRLDYDDETFDFIYALSVFTHLMEAQQYFWINELRRVLKAGGHLLITVHGSDYYLDDDILPQDHERFRQGELIVYGGELEGTNICTAFHPSRYVRQELAKNFKVIDYIPEGALGNPRQDIFLLQRTTETAVAVVAGVKDSGAALPIRN